MYKRVFDIHGWKLSTHAFNEGDIRLYESLTSIGNGYMGMRGNFEEGFSGDSHTGTYIAGIWFPDKTRVGWWKNGYPKYFGKVINAVNFAAIGVEINGKTVDLHTSNFSDYYEELDMRSGLLTRSYTVDSVKLTFRRFFSIVERRTAEFQLIIEGKAEALTAAEELAKEGIEAMVINMATIKPLDEALVLAAAKKCGKITTAEEHSVIGGLGEAVCSALSKKLPTPVKCIGVNDEFGHSGSASALLKAFGLSAEHVLEVAKHF